MAEWQSVRFDLCTSAGSSAQCNIFTSPRKINQATRKPICHAHLRETAPALCASPVCRHAIAAGHRTQRHDVRVRPLVALHACRQEQEGRSSTCVSTQDTEHEAGRENSTGFD